MKKAESEMQALIPGSTTDMSKMINQTLPIMRTTYEEQRAYFQQVDTMLEFLTEKRPI
jgi:hypothetical protein